MKAIIYIIAFSFMSISIFGKLEVLGKISEFELTDHRNQKVSYEKNLKGKNLAALFIFTKCQNVCPVLLKKYKEYAKSFPQLHYIVLTVDPEFDSPSVMNEYAKRFQLNENASWSFLTGDKNYLDQLYRKQFLIGNVDGSHIEKVVLIDKIGLIRGYFPLDDIKELTKNTKQLIEGN